MAVTPHVYWWFVACRVTPPPPCAPSHSSEATTAGGGTPRPPPRHDDCATVGRTVQCRACSSRPSAPRGIGCGHVGISRAGREVHVPVDTVLWCPSGHHVHSRRPVAQRDRSQPSRETHPCGCADHRAWAPGSSRRSHNDPTSPTRCPEEPDLTPGFVVVMMTSWHESRQSV